MNKPYVCYLLTSMDDKRTYVGITNNMPRRLRQHNGELSGGAKATRGNKWRIVLTVSGFRTHGEALMFEWVMHHCRAKGLGKGIERRLNVLRLTLAKERWTRRAPLARDVPLCVNWSDDAALLFAGKRDRIGSDRNSDVVGRCVSDPEESEVRVVSDAVGRENGAATTQNDRGGDGRAGASAGFITDRSAGITTRGVCHVALVA